MSRADLLAAVVAATLLLVGLVLHMVGAVLLRGGLLAAISPFACGLGNASIALAGLLGQAVLQVSSTWHHSQQSSSATPYAILSSWTSRLFFGGIVAAHVVLLVFMLTTPPSLQTLVNGDEVCGDDDDGPDAFAIDCLVQAGT